MVDMIRTRMTAQEFMLLPETNLPAELIDGELIMSLAPEDAHQQTSMKTILALAKILPEGGEFRHAPTDVYFDEINYFQPDIFWVSKDNQRCHLENGKYWRGAPDLIVEIFSPSTERSDRKKKFEIYEQYGVREYWMIDPLAQYIEVWALQENKFVRMGVYGPGEGFDSPVLNFKTFTADSIFS